MNRLIEIVSSHPRITATLGAISGWFSVDSLAHAKDVAQLFAAIIASLVSLCALILTGPQAVTKLCRWVRSAASSVRLIFNRQ